MQGSSREVGGPTRLVAGLGVGFQALVCLLLVGGGAPSVWLGMLGAALLSVWLSGRLLAGAQAPLEQLGKRLSAVAEMPTGASPVPESGPRGPLEQAVAELHRKVTRSLELTRRNREEAQDAGVYKTAFLKAVSHELRTPLNAILGFCDVLLSGLEGELSAGRRENLEVIRDAGQRLLEIFNDSIELSTMASGQLSLRREHVDVRMLLEEVVEALEHKRGHKPVHIHVAMPDVPLALSVQRDRLSAALKTLGEYALARTEAGAVTFSADERASADLPESRSPATITIEIQDGGPPADLESLGALFRPELAQDVNSRRLALRLAISRQLIELHDGRLKLVGDVEGRAFEIQLPAAAVSTVRPEATHA
ncbi:MAG: HAMP domain-containing sensor histidine kinase [Myxococcales bacterium]|nr:HAMP domain-containing sensor histidine kinase [Myxococcales bacterium]